MHKHLCSTFVNFTTSPGKGYRRVIVLPRDSNKPHFAWMETWVLDADDDEDWDPENEDLAIIDEETGVPELDAELGSEIGYPKALFGNASFQSYNEIVVGKIGRGENLDHSIAVYHEVHPGAVNQCLEFLTRGKASKELRLAGRGLIILYCMSKAAQPKFVRDANCSDLTLGIKGWFEYNKQYGERRW